MTLQGRWHKNHCRGRWHKSILGECHSYWLVELENLNFLLKDWIKSQINDTQNWDFCQMNQDFNKKKAVINNCNQRTVIALSSLLLPQKIITTCQIPVSSVLVCIFFSEPFWPLKCPAFLYCIHVLRWTKRNVFGPKATTIFKELFKSHIHLHQLRLISAPYPVPKLWKMLLPGKLPTKQKLCYQNPLPLNLVFNWSSTHNF